MNPRTKKLKMNLSLFQISNYVKTIANLRESTEPSFNVRF